MTILPCGINSELCPKGEGWVSVKERLPDNGAGVFVYMEWKEEGEKINDQLRFEICTFFNGNFIAKDGAECFATTHWQPLPAPPADGQGET